MALNEVLDFCFGQRRLIGESKENQKPELVPFCSPQAVQAER